ncbi:MULTISPECIES: phosphatase PAP2 family protein [unclassified Microbacterium]|uniref:phosphatase PAP2 family protein n=1 Tax=unclassified Microbacterium TaxID=2609290 RepID=UPI000EAA2C0C|nr:MULTISPECIES: phosphatase PAP2 family protein [unclassified Microbacterium]MBT2483500.1 phosphatase PAP2 family protein [Microbacterium sp. ISL-108]RKN66519.1 phosphatase PAP2 family protein [Microbacterium sp. CGR2]
MSAVDVPSARARSVGLLIGIAASVAFVVLRVVVALDDHKPLAVDIWWHDLMDAATGEIGLVVAWVPAVVGGTIGMIIVGAVLILLLLWRGRRWDAATLAIAMVTVVAIGATMAAVIGRTRPSDSLAESVATSFPSGHTAVATTVVVILGLVLRRWYVWTSGAVWVVTMMWSRTYLHAHWLSDVVAGMLEGIAVATLVWVAVEAARDRHAARAVASSRASTIEGSTTS